MPRTVPSLVVVSVLFFATAAVAEDASSSRTQSLKKSVQTMTPQTRVNKVDHERLAVRRIDVVDDKGVIRLVLSAPTPPPIIDGVQYKRAFPVSGLTYYDQQGNERGGLGVADI